MTQDLEQRLYSNETTYLTRIPFSLQSFCFFLPISLMLESLSPTLSFFASKIMHSLWVQSLLPLLLITFFLSINVELSLSADDEHYANCSEAISCGNSEGISYPFWGVNRASYCGEPGYEVQCQSDVSVINMSSATYRILEMVSTNPRSVRVARQDYWQQICPRTYVNTTIDFSLFDYASGYTNVSFYYGCNPVAVIPSQLSCTINSTPSLVYFVPGTTGFGQVSSITCSYQVVVPVFTTDALNINATESTVIDQVDDGFPLLLETNNTQCDRCAESGGRCGYNTSSAGFLCLCQDQPYPSICDTTVTPASNSSGGGRVAIGWAVAIVSFGSATVGITVIVCQRFLSRERILIFFKRGRKDEFDVEAFLRNYGSLTPKRYSYSSVKKMTKSFKDQIGKGGYGSVYKGRLPDGLVVAVKVLSESKGNGEDFINEVASIGRTSHVNIVTLSGFCYERDKRALIYEYMPNGSLDNFIGSEIANCRLEWKKLSEIAVGIARGLEYLHRGCNTRILHLDIKPQNILLDKDFCPKVADFGLAKLCKTKESIVSMMGTRGTPGYIAPEVFSRTFGGVSHKSDVYSYGMLVLEMVGARKNLDSGVSHTSEMFPHYIYKDLELIDRDDNVFGAISEEEKEMERKMVLISMWCIQTIPSERPSMSKVVEMLEGPLHSLQIAPKPCLFSPTVIAEECVTTSLLSSGTS